MRKYIHSNPAILLFFVSSFIVLHISVYTNFMLGTISEFLRENIEARLIASSRALDKVVTPEELDALRVPEDMEKPLYADIKNRLIVFGNETNVLFAYYLRETADGQTQFIVDNDTTEDTVGLATDPIPIEDAPRKALEGTAVTAGLGNYSEGYTGLLSAFAPVFDADGKVVAIAGVDITDEQVLLMRGKITTLTILMLLAMIAVIASGCLSFFLYRKKEKSLHKRLVQQELMSKLSQSFISTDSTPALINNALRITGEFLGVTRILVYLVAPETDAGRTAYVWQAADEIFAAPAVPGLRELTCGSFPQKAPPEGTVPILSCNDTHADVRKQYQILAEAGIKSFIWAPLYTNGTYRAILGV